MSYDPEYKEWVEKLLAKSGRELHKVYRGIPVIRLTSRGDPPRYRYRAPVVRGGVDEYEVLCEKIDGYLENPSIGRVEASKKPVEKIEKDEAVLYYQKWQDCQVELEDMKRREAKILADVEKLRGRMEEISSARIQLEKDVTELKSQVKEYEKIVAELEKKK